MTTKPLLAYWDLRGLREPIRYLLEYSDLEYDEKKYVCGDAPDFDRSAWTSVKNELGLSFPNLPYYIDGEMKITESWAIMRHIARKNDLMPVGEKACIEADMCEGVIGDFRWSFIMVCYLPDNFERNKANFLATLPDKLKQFDSFLAGRKWLAGERLTYVDFAMCEIHDHVRMMFPGSYKKDDYPNLDSYLSAFFKLEKIEAFRTSDRFRKFPVNNKRAHWGGQQDC